MGRIKTKPPAHMHDYENMRRSNDEIQNILSQIPYRDAGNSAQATHHHDLKGTNDGGNSAASNTLESTRLSYPISCYIRRPPLSKAMQEMEDFIDKAYGSDLYNLNQIKKNYAPIHHAQLKREFMPARGESSKNSGKVRNPDLSSSPGSEGRRGGSSKSASISPMGRTRCGVTDDAQLAGNGNVNFANVNLVNCIAVVTAQPEWNTPNSTSIRQPARVRKVNGVKEAIVPKSTPDIPSELPSTTSALKCDSKAKDQTIGAVLEHSHGVTKMTITKVRFINVGGSPNPVMPTTPVPKRSHKRRRQEAFLAVHPTPSKTPSTASSKSSTESPSSSPDAERVEGEDADGLSRPKRQRRASAKKQEAMEAESSRTAKAKATVK